MDGKEKNFGKKINTNGFDKNPDNARMGGRPKRTVKLINAELVAEGYELLKKDDIVSCYLTLLSLDTPKLIEMTKDEKQPVLIRVVGKNILSNKGFDIIEKMLDRGIGKATTDITLRTNGEQPLFNLDD